MRRYYTVLILCVSSYLYVEVREQNNVQSAQNSMLQNLWENNRSIMVPFRWKNSVLSFFFSHCETAVTRNSIHWIQARTFCFALVTYNNIKHYTHLEIPVHYALLVHVIHSFQYLTDQMSGVLLGVRALLHNAVEQFASGHPAETLAGVRSKISQYITMYHISHNYTRTSKWTLFPWIFSFDPCPTVISSEKSRGEHNSSVHYIVIGNLFTLSAYWIFGRIRFRMPTLWLHAIMVFFKGRNSFFFSSFCYTPNLLDCYTLSKSYMCNSPI